MRDSNIFSSHKLNITMCSIFKVMLMGTQKLLKGNMQAICIIKLHKIYITIPKGLRIKQSKVLLTIQDILRGRQCILNTSKI